MENYGTLAGADAYHSVRGNAAWTGADAAKLAALVRASTFIDGMGQRPLKSGAYTSLYPGTKTGGRPQLLAWPRTDATDQDGVDIDPVTVPAEVERATYEAALREIAEPGSLSPDYVAAQQIKREKVDVLETEYLAPQGTPNAPNPARPVVSVVLDILTPVMTRPTLTTGIGVA